VYVNNRPVASIGKADVQHAFEVLGGAKGTGLIDRDFLLAELQRRGAGQPFLSVSLSRARCGRRF
jgi:hypothetical protein